MDILTLDYETAFGDNFTLKKMTTEAYVRDPRFEALLLGYRLPDGTCGWVGQEHIPAFLGSFDWSKTAVLHHHAHFDALISAHHYGVRPVMIFDTLSMARAILGNHMRASLDFLSKYFGFEAKSVPYEMFKNRAWANLYPHERQMLGDGAAGDCRITWSIFQKLAEGFPMEEYEIISDTVKMFTEPQVVGDVQLLDALMIREEEKKSLLMQQLGVTETDLQSADKFVELLNELEVDVEWKPGKNGPIPAIAKTDDFMKALVASDDELIATLAEARLAVRSTLQESRAGRMGDMARRGAMCVYIAYAAAHTLRFGGGDKMNWQNFPRVNPEKPGSGDLRASVCAPEGYSIVAPDLSQIECRILNYVAGEETVLEAFRGRRDVYAEAASRFYGQPINKQSHPLQRQLFKQVELGCGYGLGAPRFAIYAKSGVGGPPIHLTHDEAQAAIQFYRDDHPNVVGYWGQAKRIITHLAGLGGSPIPWGPMEINEGYIKLPNGLKLQYPGLDFNHSEGENMFEGWSYRTRNGRTKLYGGKLVENVVQALARVVVTQAWLRIKKGCGLRPWLSTHDDLAYLVEDKYAVEANAWMIEEMKKAPEWLPGIPLDAEGEPSKRYVK